MKSSRAVKPSRVRVGAELEEVNAERRIWREENDERRQQTNGKSCQLAASLTLDNTRSVTELTLPPYMWSDDGLLYFGLWTSADDDGGGVTSGCCAGAVMMSFSSENSIRVFGQTLAELASHSSFFAHEKKKQMDLLK
ncbi:hypothetical protein M0R45_020664 [Rubus argutus]|uniref:Uncharacterized protein n=1 Tax=Rubus argutus TaxID=59490 RepID=A0AAW1X933_RUBAR